MGRTGEEHVALLLRGPRRLPIRRRRDADPDRSQLLRPGLADRLFDDVENVVVALVLKQKSLVRIARCLRLEVAGAARQQAPVLARDDRVVLPIVHRQRHARGRQHPRQQVEPQRSRHTQRFLRALERVAKPARVPAPKRVGIRAAYDQIVTALPHRAADFQRGSQRERLHPGRHGLAPVVAAEIGIGRPQAQLVQHPPDVAGSGQQQNARRLCRRGGIGHVALEV